MTIPTSIETVHGTLHLPVYFPDATRGVVRTVDSQDLETCGVQGLVVNAFHLSTRPGAGLIKGTGGIHRFMGWRRPIASDSGGFQLMSMIRENPRYGMVTRRGVHFTDLDGNRKKTLFTPERSIRLQFDLGADLVVCLDDCPSPDAPLQEVEESVERTIHWAKRCRAEFDRQIKARYSAGSDLAARYSAGSDLAARYSAGSDLAARYSAGSDLAARYSAGSDLAARHLVAGPRPLLFGVVQGGYDRELRARCAEALLPLGFDGFGFGGWPLTPDGELAYDILAYTAGLTPQALPRFALGVGKPEHIVRCYLAGWRIFDCVLPTRDARHGRLYAFRADHLDEVDLRSPDFYRFLYIRDEAHRRQQGPISTACDCPCCREYSLAYVHHLFGVGDPLGLRLATLHNLRFYTQLMERVSAL